VAGLGLLAAAVGFSLWEEEEASAESCRHKWVDGHRNGTQVRKRGGREGNEHRRRRRRKTTAAKDGAYEEEA